MRLHSSRAYPVSILQAACFLASVMLAGCASSAGTLVNAQELYETLERKAQRNFAQAIYAKPLACDRSILHERLAPIIIHEVRQAAVDEAALSRLHPSAASSLSGGAHLLANAKATVYFSQGSAKIGKSEYDQVLYFWFYESHNTVSQASAQLRGVRITVGLDGFPLVWELIAGSAGAFNHDANDVIYVSHSGELAARALYGIPLPSRRWAMERRWNDASNTIVARLVEDGPLPMGSYIYLQDTSHEISTVLCRCSPSQVDSFVEEITYDLVPAETLKDFDWNSIGLIAPLDLRLRWPAGL